MWQRARTLMPVMGIAGAKDLPAGALVWVQGAPIQGKIQGHHHLGVVRGYTRWSGLTREGKVREGGIDNRCVELLPIFCERPDILSDACDHNFHADCDTGCGCTCHDPK